MAEGILGLGQGQAGALNNDMLEKLKAVDRKATVEPIEKKLENFEPEREAISNISTKVDEFLNALSVRGSLSFVHRLNRQGFDQ